MSRCKRYGSFLAVLLCGAVLGCTDHHASVSRSPDVDQRSPRGHWVRDFELRELMSKLVYDTRWPARDHDPESTTPAQKSATLHDAAQLAEALANAGREIPTHVDESDLSEADYRGFSALAMTLHDQALALRDAAQQEDIERLQRLLHTIDETCISCHGRYREIAGTLEPRQARGADVVDKLALVGER